MCVGGGGVQHVYHCAQKELKVYANDGVEWGRGGGGGGRGGQHHYHRAQKKLKFHANGGVRMGRRVKLHYHCALTNSMQTGPKYHY